MGGAAPTAYVVVISPPLESSGRDGENSTNEYARLYIFIVCLLNGKRSDVNTRLVQNSRFTGLKNKNGTDSTRSNPQKCSLESVVNHDIILNVVWGNGGPDLNEARLSKLGLPHPWPHHLISWSLPSSHSLVRTLPAR